MQAMGGSECLILDVQGVFRLTLSIVEDEVLFFIAFCNMPEVLIRPIVIE
jgi:hypothetical protein